MADTDVVQETGVVNDAGEVLEQKPEPSIASLYDYGESAPSDEGAVEGAEDKTAGTPGEEIPEAETVTDEATDLLEDAKAFGFSEDFSKKLAEAGVLQDVILDAARREMASQAGEAEVTEEVPAAAPKPAVPPKAEQLPSAALEPLDLGLDPEIHGEEIVGAFD